MNGAMYLAADAAGSAGVPAERKGWSERDSPGADQAGGTKKTTADVAVSAVTSDVNLDT